MDFISHKQLINEPLIKMTDYCIDFKNNNTMTEIRKTPKRTLFYFETDSHCIFNNLLITPPVAIQNCMYTWTDLCVR